MPNPAHLDLGSRKLRRRRLLLVASTVVSATLWVYACGDGTTEPRPSGPDPQQPTTVAVTPATATILEGNTLRLRAVATNAHGQRVTGVEFVWASGDTAVTLVDASGLVTGVAPGQAQVTAATAGVTGRAQLTVVVNPDRVALVALYNATDGPNWLNNENWLTDARLDEWHGVETNAAGRVVRIDLGAQWDDETQEYVRHGLRGELPGELANLTELTDLDLGDNNLTGPIPAELGNLAELGVLELDFNNLTGAIPPALDNLTELTNLDLEGNDLTGPVPQGFLQLGQLQWFRVGGQDVCVPGTSAFVAWFERIERRGTATGIFCNAADVAALESLYQGTDGTGWTESDGWSSDDAVEEWNGVTVDSLGHVTELDLEGNGLTGPLPGTIGDLPRMTVLRISDNALSGRLPQSLTDLRLVEFRYSETELCAPVGAAFQDWLKGIASLEGTGVNCEPPSSDRDILEIFYYETGGPNWTHQNNWLTDAPLETWYGVEVDGEGRVSELRLTDNNLTGRLPPELGNLAELVRLDLGTYLVLGRVPNNLTGPIPPELGNLRRLRELNLWQNGLTGPIPPELGKLATLGNLVLSANNLTGAIPPELGNIPYLVALDLRWNGLTGPIPPELSNLARLSSLRLDENNLTGPIPPELGGLANLWSLSLSSNALSGSVPPELGELTRLRSLTLARNPGLTGALPHPLTGLDRLEEFLAGGTGLCAPMGADFQAWLGGVRKHWIALCSAGGLPAAYLTQAVQSREFPVPLVAGEPALLRVFPTAGQATSTGIPAVRARFYVNGRGTHVQEIAGKSDPIPTEVDERSLSRSANAEIAGRLIQPGLEMVIEVDPDNTLDPELGVAKRIPAAGRLAVEVKAMPPFDLTVIPFVWTETHDSSIVDLVGAMAADPEHHEMLGQTRTLLPVGTLAVTAHEPVLSSSNHAYELLSQTHAIRVMEGGTGHYKGTMSPPVTGPGGVAHRPGWSSFSTPYEGTIAHELGHNLNLSHAPCGGAAGPDPAYPYPDGSTGAWGYDFRDGGRLVRPSTPDLMSYCGPKWISAFHFTNSLRYRLFDEGSAAAADSVSTQSLLLWGGVGADSVPYLEPAFVIDAPAVLPDSAGEYRIAGRNPGGGELFSLNFTMPATADGDGSSSFAFGLPVRAGWEASLATITLSGPGGTAALDGDNDIPMAILRDLRTGQVRGILRDPPPATQAAADAVGVSAPGAPGLEVLFSRGIPSAAAWRR